MERPLFLVAIEGFEPVKELHETLSSASVLMTATDSPRYRHLDISEEVTKLQLFKASQLTTFRQLFTLLTYSVKRSPYENRTRLSALKGQRPNR